MKKEITERAECKINLFLEVGNKLPNGYHEMDMVMSSLSLCDSLKIKKTNSGGISVKCNVPLPNQEDTIIYRCAESFFDSLNIKDKDTEIELSSQIPFMSGLGGGSADGAAVLRGLCKLYDIEQDFDFLSKIGAKIGADIPFCLYNGLCKVGGFGEKLFPIETKNPLSFAVVLAKPKDFSISTGTAFSEIDQKADRKLKQSREIISAIKGGNLKEIASLCYNGFYEAGKENYMPCKTLLDAIFSLGSLGGAMTGSGSAVFGVFENLSMAKEAVSELQKSKTLPDTDFFAAENTEAVF